MTAIETAVLGMAQKIARRVGKSRPLVEVAAAHDVSLWTDSLPEGVGLETPCTRLSGGYNGKRPLYLAGQSLFEGTFFGRNSSFKSVPLREGTDLLDPAALARARAADEAAETTAAAFPAWERWINLTPHEVVVGEVHIPPSGRVARVSTTSEVVGEIAGIEVVETTLGRVEGSSMGVVAGAYYVVSRMVKTALGVERRDCLVPDGLVRDEAGRVVGAERLAL